MVIGVHEVAGILGLSHQHVRYLIRNGRIKAQKIGRNYVIDKKDLKGIKRLRPEKKGAL